MDTTNTLAPWEQNPHANLPEPVKAKSPWVVITKLDNGTEFTQPACSQWEAELIGERNTTEGLKLQFKQGGWITFPLHRINSVKIKPNEDAPSVQ